MGDKFIRRLSILISLLLFLTGCAPLSHAYQVVSYKLMSPANRYMAEGDQLASEDRLAEALLAYRQAVILEPKNVIAIRKLASMYKDEGRLRLAARFLREAQSIDPQDQEIQKELESINLEYRNALLNLLWQTNASDSSPTGMDQQDDEIFVGYEDGAVADINSKDGSLIWKALLDGRVSSTPHADRETVYVGQENGNLVALSRVDGSIRWTFNTLGAIHATVVIANSMVLCASSDNNLYALDKQSGSLIWKYTSGGALRAQPAVIHEIIYFGAMDARLYAIYLKDGSSFWQTGILTQGGIESSVRNLENRIFFGSGDGRVYALAADTGGEFWRYSTADAVYATPVIDKGVLYLASSGQVVAAVDAVSGEMLWETELAVPIHDAPAITDERVYLLAPGSAELIALDRETGDLLWQMNTLDWTVGSPIADEGKVYVLGKDGTVLAFQE
jgi:outer membrane protein assembly factor BamB